LEVAEEADGVVFVSETVTVGEEAQASPVGETATEGVDELRPMLARSNNFAKVERIAVRIPGLPVETDLAAAGDCGLAFGVVHCPGDDDGDDGSRVEGRGSRVGSCGRGRPHSGVTHVGELEVEGVESEVVAEEGNGPASVASRRADAACKVRHLVKDCCWRRFMEWLRARHRRKCPTW
jgi:hypothetical protein